MVVECTKCGWFREVMPPPKPEEIPTACPRCELEQTELTPRKP